jgi:predicted metalloenzyme YecM
VQAVLIKWKNKDMKRLYKILSYGPMYLDLPAFDVLLESLYDQLGFDFNTISNGSVASRLSNEAFLTAFMALRDTCGSEFPKIMGNGMACLRGGRPLHRL